MSINAGKLLLDALGSHWDKYHKRLKACSRNINEQAVHDLRTSTRRLLSVIELVRALEPCSKLGRVREMFKTQLDGFDDLRDTQVMLIEIAKTVDRLPELTPFQHHLQEREQQLLFQTQAFIKNFSTGKLKRKLKKSQGRCKKKLTAKKDINLAVLAVIDSLYATALTRRQTMDPSQLPTIHHLRIAVKKLRYTLAVIHPILPGFPEEQLKSMQEYLTLMGDIQNSSVLFQALESFFDAGVPLSVKEHFRLQQLALLEAFMLRKDEVLGFWRRAGGLGVACE